MNHIYFATIEARMTSSRLPGKVLLDAAGKPMLERMIERVRRVSLITDIIVATTTNPTDDPIADLARKLDVKVYRGDEHDVMRRVLEAAHMYAVDVIVELTGDCPVIDPEVVESVILAYDGDEVDYCSNTLTRSYPIGMDTQVFSTGVLADAFLRTDDPCDREHVSRYIHRHPELYKLKGIVADDERYAPNLRLTLDTKEDLLLLRAVFEWFTRSNPAFTLDDVLKLLKMQPELRRLNADVQHRWV